MQVGETPELGILPGKYFNILFLIFPHLHSTLHLSELYVSDRCSLLPVSWQFSGLCPVSGLPCVFPRTEQSKISPLSVSASTRPGSCWARCRETEPAGGGGGKYRGCWPGLCVPVPSRLHHSNALVVLRLNTRHSLPGQGHLLDNEFPGLTPVTGHDEKHQHYQHYHQLSW